MILKYNSYLEKIIRSNQFYFWNTASIDFDDCVLYVMAKLIVECQEHIEDNITSGHAKYCGEFHIK